MAKPISGSRAGIWWPLDEPDATSPGVLIHDDGYELRLFEQEKLAKSESPFARGSLRLRYMDGIFRDIGGYADGKSVSILGAYGISASSSETEHSRIQKALIRPSQIWSGQGHISNSTNISSFSFTFDGVQQIIGTNYIKHVTPDRIFLELTDEIRNSHELFRSLDLLYITREPIFEQDATFQGKSLSIRCAPSVTTEHSSSDGVNVSGRCYINVHVASGCNLDFMWDVLDRVKIFVSYCCLSKVGVSEISLITENDHYIALDWDQRLESEEVIRKSHPIEALFWISQDGHAAGRGLKAWLEDEDAQRLACWFTYEAMGTKSYGPSKFLRALQAWELLAEDVDTKRKLERSQFRSLREKLSKLIDEELSTEQSAFIKARLDRLNAPALHDRVEQLIGSIGEPVAQKVVGDLQDFVRQTVSLRNDLSHMSVEGIAITNSSFRKTMILTSKLVVLSCIHQLLRAGLSLENVEQTLLNNRIGKLALERIPA